MECSNQSIISTKNKLKALGGEFGAHVELDSSEPRCYLRAQPGDVDILTLRLVFVKVVRLHGCDTTVWNML